MNKNASQKLRELLDATYPFLNQSSMRKCYELETVYIYVYFKADIRPEGVAGNSSSAPYKTQRERVHI